MRQGFAVSRDSSAPRSNNDTLSILHTTSEDVIALHEYVDASNVLDVNMIDHLIVG